MSYVKTITISANMAEGFAIRGDIDGHTVMIDQPVAAKNYPAWHAGKSRR
jgi:putative redox protein